MFNIPFVFRGANTASGVPPLIGNAEAIVWLDAAQLVYKDNGVTPAVYGDDIKQWNDLTSYKNNVTGTTNFIPMYSGITFTPSGSTSIFPYVQFNELHEDNLSAAKSNSLMTMTSGFTLFFVIRRNTTGAWSPGANPVIQWNDSWTTPTEGFGVDGDSVPNNLDCFYYSNSAVKTVISIPWGSGGNNEENFYYYTVRFSANTALGTGVINGYSGKVLKDTASNTVGNVFMKKPTTNTVKFSIASGFDNGVRTQTSELDVTEVILYNDALDNSGLQVVWNYLITKYGFV